MTDASPKRMEMPDNAGSITPRPVRSRKRFDIAPWGFILPALLLYLAFVIFPAVKAILISLQENYLDKFVVHWIGMANYARMFHDTQIWSSIRVSLTYTAIIVPSVVILAGLSALALGKLRGSWKVLRMFLLMPMVIAAPISAQIWYTIYDSHRGLLNWILHDLGVAHPPVWLDIHLALPAVAVAHIWAAIAFGTLLFTVSLDAIPETLYDAAAVDGAGPLQQLWHITLPGLSKMAGVVGTLVMLGAMRDFQYPFIITKGGPAGATETFSYHMYRTAFADVPYDLGYAAAMSVSYALVLLLVSIIIFRITRKAALT